MVILDFLSRNYYGVMLCVQSTASKRSQSSVSYNAQFAFVFNERLDDVGETANVYPVTCKTEILLPTPARIENLLSPQGYVQLYSCINLRQQFNNDLRELASKQDHLLNQLRGTHCSQVQFQLR